MIDFKRRRLFSRTQTDDKSPRLPWLKQPEQFTDQCTRCGKCIAYCDTQIIVKSDGGFPRIDFSIDECSFCYQCAEVCPEPLFAEQSQLPWGAKANINNACLAFSNIDCRSCSDSCEVMAIQFQLMVGKVAQPTINTQQCTGCGACVSTCPTSAILVHNP